MKRGYFAFVFITSTIYALYALTPEETSSNETVSTTNLGATSTPSSPILGDAEYDKFCRTAPLSVSCTPEL